jgi:hypothetical protein
MTERQVKWSLDADIVIDYTTNPPNVSFLNVDKLSRKAIIKHILVFFFLSFVICFAIFAIISFPSLHMFLLTVVALTFFFSVYFYGQVALFANLRFMRFYLKFKTRKPRRQVTITNPEGTVRYHTTRSDPLIDLEYDGDLREHLTKVTFFKEKSDKKNRVHTIKELAITFNGKTNGILTIKDY